ncbi:MAG TPA: cupin domain-containing protein [Edaphobacter sp.]|nr:cupin domain-containing protein [Edaphobacter sp.]
MAINPDNKRCDERERDGCGRGAGGGDSAGGIVLRFLIDRPSTGAGMTMFEMTVAPGAGMPVPHHHVGFDESGYGVSGRLRFMLEGQSTDVGEGDLVWIERGKVHAFSNPFDEPAKVLCTITPGGWGRSIFGRFVGCWVGVGRLIRRRWER